MKRRSRAGGKPAKVRRRSALKPKGRSAPKAMPRRGSAPAGRDTEVARLTRERDEALEQQAATADILRIISSSPGNLNSVLETILANATRLCEANFRVLLLYEGSQFRVAAAHNPPPSFAELRRRQPEIRSSGVLARVAVTKQLLHIADCTEDASYKQGDDDFVAFVDLCGVRTLLDAPLLKKGELIGTIALYRQEVRLFTDQQVELVRNFAAQALIAIDNARLLNELRQRTGDLSEALQQQSATLEILKVISNSPTDSQPAFDAIVRSGLRLFPNAVIAISLPDGDKVKVAAIDGADRADLEALRARYPLPLSREYITSTAILDRRELDFADARDTPVRWIPGGQNFLASGYRAITVMPMMRGDSAIGAISVVRRQPGALSDKQREVSRSFANQAVIAIENTRLFNELRDSLQEQTATSEVLQVVSSSPGDLEPVFAAMLEKAVRICDAKFGNIYRWDDDALHLVATHNTPPAFAEARRYSLFKRPGPQTVTGRMLSTQAVVHVADATAEPGYGDKSDPGAVAAVELGGVRTILAVPMRKEDELIGSFTVYRQEVRPFTDKQIALVTNFANQAVIAIENARLLNELRQRTTDLTEALEQQTATSEVLQVISGSPGDVEPVFSTMLEKAVRICDASFGNIYRWDGKALNLVATHNTPPAFAEARGRSTLRPGSNSLIGRMLATKADVHIADVAATQAYEQRVPETVEAVELGGVRTILGVPMHLERELIGSFTLYRTEVSPFTDKQIALVTNFAAQAVIAIENTRLLNELRESLQEQTATSEVLQVISSSPGDVQPVFATMLEKAVSICDATFGNIYRWDGDALHLVSSHNTPPTFAQARKRSPHRPPEQNADSLASVPGRMVTTKSTIHVADLAADQAYLERHPQTVAAVELGGVRTFLGVPMLKEGELIGAFALSRQEVRPFTDKQIELVKNFAAQAVIAIENARLLNELRQRTERKIKSGTAYH